MKTLVFVLWTLTFLTTANLYAETLPDLRVAAGRKLFVRHCSECHGPEGLGTERAPSIANVVRQKDRSSLRTFIKNGDLRGGMPSWSKLPDKRLDQIVAYLKSVHSQER
jgi:mono/diheme cytochrome c family protein